jgi:hypothetical protein
MNEALYRGCFLFALLVIAASLYTMASVSAFDFMERRMLPAPTPIPMKTPDDA